MSSFYIPESEWSWTDSRHQTGAHYCTFGCFGNFLTLKKTDCPQITHNLPLPWADCSPAFARVEASPLGLSVLRPLRFPPPLPLEPLLCPWSPYFIARVLNASGTFPPFLTATSTYLVENSTTSSHFLQFKSINNKEQARVTKQIYRDC